MKTIQPADMLQYHMVMGAPVQIKTDDSLVLDVARKCHEMLQAPTVRNAYAISKGNLIWRHEDTSMSTTPTDTDSTCSHEKLDVHKSVQYTAVYNYKTQMARLDEGPIIDWDATCQNCGAEVTTGYWNDEPKGMYDIRG